MNNIGTLLGEITGLHAQVQTEINKRHKVLELLKTFAEKIRSEIQRINAESSTYQQRQCLLVALYKKSDKALSRLKLSTTVPLTRLNQSQRNRRQDRWNWEKNRSYYRKSTKPGRRPFAKSERSRPKTGFDWLTGWYIGQTDACWNRGRQCISSL